MSISKTGIDFSTLLDTIYNAKVNIAYIGLKELYKVELYKTNKPQFCAR